MADKIDRWELEKILKEPIKSHHWEPQLSSQQEAAAKAALMELLELAKRYLPRTRNVFIGRDNTPLHDGNANYLRLMLQIQSFMESNQWVKACEDMVDVLHFFHIEDRRILGNIIATMEEYLHDTAEISLSKVEAKD